MPLHIFEPRYRRMVDRCEKADRRFGLIYHDSDRMGPFLCEAGRVGCVAEIQDRERLPDGRSLVVVRGIERFEIDDGIESGEPYYEALVGPYEDTTDELATLLERRLEVLSLFEQVLGDPADRPRRLPDFDVGKELSFPLASLLQSDPRWLQGFLAITSEGRRLGALELVFRAVLDADGE